MVPIIIIRQLTDLLKNDNAKGTFSSSVANGLFSGTLSKAHRLRNTDYRESDIQQCSQSKIYPEL
jgi:hypothetical protein